jgi:acetyl-CoA/propionyl-CoA carboxylase, biotin carboxylase, biotin carboxyl carrier protein
MMISSVLIANRGEIAIRIAATLKRLGIESVGIYTYADAHSMHLRYMDEVHLVGPSYLDIDQVIEAARRSGADAIHPGYGFLAENALFAQACADAGITFIGPSADAISSMGGKIAARELAIAADVPVIPGAAGSDDQSLLSAAKEIGFPLLIKPSAGGGGKGLHIVNAIDEMAGLLEVARREARSSFGDDALLIERYLAKPRHIEFQILGDASGEVIHLGERECTLQRRHQKVIEEAPSALLDPAMRSRMGDAAVALAKAIGYTNAGTVEFLIDAADPEFFYFIEMNTRLQVEHRVTEQIYGVDLVEMQIALANGRTLSEILPNPTAQGHSIEARIYAEDPRAGFLPTGGPVLRFAPAADALTDSAIEGGTYVSSSYDPMLAKVVVHADSRGAAIDALDQALRHTAILGLITNVDYLGELTRSEGFKSGSFDTGFISNFPASKQAPSERALSTFAAMLSGGDGWRLNSMARPEVVGFVEGERVSALPEESDLISVIDGDGVWVHDPESGTHFIQRRNPSVRAGAVGTEIALAPMPGTVISLPVASGTPVREGDALVVIEAMKMEHVVRASHAGVVDEVWVQTGEKVAARARLVRVRADG